MSGSWSSYYSPYRSQSSDSAHTATWVQIDLGGVHSINAVKLYPCCKPHWPAGDGFPLRFRIECSHESEFTTRQIIADWSKANFPDPHDQIVQFPAKGIAGRYVRLIATRLRTQKPSATLLGLLPEASRDLYMESANKTHFLALSKMEVLSKGVDLALRRPVSVDAALGNRGEAQQITRAPRPQGEGIVTDNPQNVTSPEAWRPIAYRAQSPREGVEMRG